MILLDFSRHSLVCMVVISDSLHRLARLNYFKHPPDVVVVGGNGFVGRNICKLAAQCGLIPVSISVDPSPPVISEEEMHMHSWITRTQWREGDATNPSTWDPNVIAAGCTAMIYATKPFYRNNARLWECNYEGALRSIEMARKMHANRFVYISTNLLPPVASKIERETKKRAEEVLMEYSKMSLSTDSPIQLSIVKPGWVFGKDRFSSSMVGMLLRLFDVHGKKQVQRNLSSISVETLAMAALCQALDPGLPDIIKVYNDKMQIYNDRHAREWLEIMARRIYNVKQASCSTYDFEAF